MPVWGSGLVTGIFLFIRKIAISLSVVSLFLLLRAQKKKHEKGTPTSPGPAGFPYFPPPSARRGRTNGGKKNPIGTQPSTGEAAEKGICTV